MIARNYPRRNRGLGHGDSDSFQEDSSDLPPPSQDLLCTTSSEMGKNPEFQHPSPSTNALPKPTRAESVPRLSRFSSSLPQNPNPNPNPKPNPNPNPNADPNPDASKLKKRPSPGQRMQRAESSLPPLPINKNPNNPKTPCQPVPEMTPKLRTVGKLNDEFSELLRGGPFSPPVSTLMEAQESGEMMEHIDEASFALDGLRPGQPPRIQRTSLLSLLSISVSVHGPRLLRTHRMMKPLLDALVSLPTNDPSTTTAAAALFYTLIRDGQDDSFLDSPACIKFLLRLLGPSSSLQKEKGNAGSSIGSKLSALVSRHGLHRGNGSDQEGSNVVSKVKSLLMTMKEHEFFPAEDLNSQCLSLITLEKACSSTIMLEDSSGSSRRAGGNFKERLREMGGLVNICELASNCFLNLQEAFKVSVFKDLTSVGLLLRCLKVMENVTFMSEGNQRYLLDLSLCNGKAVSSNTFIGFIIKVIKLLSEETLKLKHDFNTSSLRMNEVKISNNLARSGSSRSEDETVHSKFQQPDTRNALANKRKRNASSDIDLLEPECSSAQIRPIPTEFVVSESDLLHEGTNALQSQCVSCKGIDETACARIDDSEDPFEFTAEDPHTSQNAAEKHASIGGKPVLKKCTNLDLESGNLPAQEPFDCPDEMNEKSVLLSDCLLTAVKVLMNLTNENPIGCCQVATCEGLEIMASLIAGHCSFADGVGPQQGFTQSKEKNNSVFPNSEQDMDLLVLVLGVLVNLVEKDHTNRVRLSNLKLDVPSQSMPSQKGFIDLLCLIFLDKESTAEVAEESGKKQETEIFDEMDLRQGQQEAEDMILEAYTALLLAFLCSESKTVRSKISQYFPGRNLKALVPVLERFVAFHLSLNMISSETHSAVKDIIEVCKKS